MKAKIYIGIISALMLSALPAEAQFADSRDFRDDGATLVVNNYYDDYDYYFSSRINRFHRSYSAFSYYSPVFTETYWYSYQPWSWGMSIYGGRTLFGVGFAYNYPVYNIGWNYGFNHGWYDPWYGGSYSWGYDPFFFNWYSPVVYNVSIRNRYVYRDWGWHGNSWWRNGYRPVYNTYNTYNYYNTAPVRYSSREYSSRPVSGSAANRSESSAQRRESQVYQTPRSESGRIATGEYGSQGTVSRRPVNQDTGNQGVQSNNRGSNNGNNRNSVENGNNGYFGNNSSNAGNNGNNNNSQTGGNNGNFGNRNASNRGSVVNTPAQRNTQPSAPQRSINQSGPGVTKSPAISAPRTERVSTPAPSTANRQTSRSQSSVRSQTPARSSAPAVSRSSSGQSSKSTSSGSVKSSGSSSKSSGSSNSSSGQSTGRRR